MNKILQVVGASVATFVCSNALALNIGVVNMQEIFSSPHGISEIQSKLESKFSDKRGDMVKMMKQLQADQKDFEKNKAVWSKAKVAKAESKLNSGRSKFQIAQASYQKAVMKAQQDEMKSFVGKVKIAAENVAKKDNLDAVFVDNSLLYAKTTKDITSDVMSKLQ